MGLLALQNNVLVIGTSGSGKSIQLMKLVRHGLEHGHRFLVGDHLTQWHPPDWPARRVKIVRTANLEKLCRLACRLGGWWTIVYDEADQVLPARFPIDEKTCVYEVLHMGRQIRPPGPEVLWPHAGPIGTLFATRRPANLRTDVKDLCKKIYLGHCQGKSTIDWVADAIDDEETARALRTLPMGEFIARELA